MKTLGLGLGTWNILISKKFSTLYVKISIAIVQLGRALRLNTSQCCVGESIILNRIFLSVINLCPTSWIRSKAKEKTRKWVVSDSATNWVPNKIERTLHLIIDEVPEQSMLDIDKKKV